MEVKRVGAALCVGLLLGGFSAEAAEYSVHDDEVRSTLRSVKSILQEIQKKEESMDLVDKTASARDNNNMLKLSGSVSFMEQGGNGTINISKIFSSHDFLGNFMESVSGRLGIPLKTVNDNEIWNEHTNLEEILPALKPGSVTSVDPVAINIEINQGNLEISIEADKRIALHQKTRSEILKNITEITKQIQEITEAKPEKTNSQKNLWGALNAQKSLLGEGASANNAIFEEKGTESIVSSQERNTALASLQLELDAQKLLLSIVDGKIQLELNLRDRHIAANERERARAMGEAEIDAIEKLPYNPRGERHKCMFEDRYPNWFK